MSKPIKPLVSVIMPVRNCCEFIHEAINSVCTQTYDNIEVLVIDDGSTDYDYKKLEGVDARIVVHQLSGNGVSYARNYGMSVSTGKYIAFLDADDTWFPGKLLAQIRYLEKNTAVGCVFGGFTRWPQNADGSFPPASTLSSESGNLTECDFDRSGWLYTRLLGGLLVGMNTAVIRRQVFERVGGFDESLRIGEDYLYWLKVSRIYELHALNAKIALYRIHNSSAMKRLDAENHEARLLEMAVARWGLINPDGMRLSEGVFKRRLAKSHFTHAYNHFWRGSASVARHSFLKSLRAGMLPVRSAVYISVIPFRRWLGASLGIKHKIIK